MRASLSNGLDLCVSVCLSALKVTLLEPLIGKQRQGATPPNPKLNAQNNLEWRLELKAGESRTISIHYTVDFPSNKEVEGL